MLRTIVSAFDTDGYVIFGRKVPLTDEFPTCHATSLDFMVANCARGPTKRAFVAIVTRYWIGAIVIKVGLRTFLEDCHLSSK